MASFSSCNRQIPEDRNSGAFNAKEVFAIETVGRCVISRGAFLNLTVIGDVTRILCASDARSKHKRGVFLVP